jgi:hypothetical protein
VRPRDLIPLVIALRGLLGATAAAAAAGANPVEVVPVLGAKSFAAPYGKSLY